MFLVTNWLENNCLETDGGFLPQSIECTTNRALVRVWGGISSQQQPAYSLLCRRTQAQAAPLQSQHQPRRLPGQTAQVLLRQQWRDLQTLRLRGMPGSAAHIALLYFLYLLLSTSVQMCTEVSIVLPLKSKPKSFPANSDLTMKQEIHYLRKLNCRSHSWGSRQCHLFLRLWI